jgi:hypothetical protein
MKSSLQRDPEGPSQLMWIHHVRPGTKKKCYTALTRLRRDEPLAIERSQQTDVRDCQEPLLQRLKTHAQRALNAKNGRNRNERHERVTPAELPPSVENAAEREETLKAQAGKQCWHHFLVAPQAVPTAAGMLRNAHMQAGCSSPVQRTKQAHT